MSMIVDRALKLSFYKYTACIEQITDTQIGMLDPIISSYQLTISMSVTY